MDERKILKSRIIQVIDKYGKSLTPTNGLVAETLIRRQKAVWVVENEVIKLLRTKNDWKAMKKRVVREENHICYICNERIPEDEPATIDHVIPKCMNQNGEVGTDKRENLRCCCKKCNDGKANRSIEEFYHYVAENKEQFPQIDLEHLDKVRKEYGKF